MAERARKTSKPEPPAKRKAPAKKTVRTTASQKPTRKQKPKTASEPQPRHAPDQKELELIRKRNKILDLREMGASIRQIADQLAAQGEDGVSKTRVHELLVEALEDLLKTQRMKTRHYRQLEINKLDRAELAIFPKLLRAAESNLLLNSDDIEKISRSLDRIWKRRDSLLGLNAPVKVDVNPREALAKLLGRNPEELPDGDADA